METGRGNTSQPSVPSVRHLAWMALLGTVLVISGTRDGDPPQPSADQAFTAPVRVAAGRTGAPASAAAALLGAPSAKEFFAPVGLGHARTGPASPQAAAPPAAPPRPAPRRTAVAPPAVRALPPSDPVRLRIPAIRVDAPVIELDLDAKGALEPPPADNPVPAGWYGGGTAPGAVGTAVTAGHVDTPVGPGVFHDLGAVTKGAVVEILRADRRTAVFSVDAVEVYDKNAFPDDKVYGPAGRPELRVITCGGGYTKKTGYRSNVVVYATLTAVRE